MGHRMHVRVAVTDKEDIKFSDFWRVCRNVGYWSLFFDAWQWFWRGKCTKLYKNNYGDDKDCYACRYYKLAHGFLCFFAALIDLFFRLVLFYYFFQLQDNIVLFDFVNLFSSHRRVKAEKARLEAFLSAVPGEYCGFSQDGSAVYSQGFCAALGLERIERFTDIQNVLSAEDGLALESFFVRLVQDGEDFRFDAVTHHDCALTLSGTRGADLSGADQFHILWLERKDEEADYGFDFMQEALDALPYPVWLRDGDQRITWCNVAYAQMVGMAPSDIFAQQKEIVSVSRKRKPEEKGFLFGAELAREAIEKSSTVYTKIHEVVKGARVLLRISEMPLSGQMGTVGLAQNITEEEVLGAKIDDNRAAHHALLEQLRSAISIYDVDQRLSFYNSSFTQLWGLEEGWLNTKPKLGEVMEKLRETRRLPEQADFRVFKKSWLKMFTSLIEPHEDMLYLPDGSALRMFVVPHKLGGLMMNFEDVSSRLELESSYNTLVAVQKETLDNLEEGVTVYGGDGRLKLWNPAFASMWGFDPETLSNEPHVTQLVEKVSSFFNETDWLKNKNTLVSLALDRSLNAGRLERENETVVDYSTLPLPDGGVLVTFTDTTDTIRVENALREKNIALEAAEQLKLDFLANVSYQLRTPLSAIMGFNEMLAQEFFGSLNKKQKEYTTDIQSASERLLNLINDILDLSTIEAGQMNLEIEDVNLKDMMESISNLVTDWARKELIEVSLKCPSNIGRAELDPSRIKQAILNLVRNAIAHTSEGGEIVLQASRKGDSVHIRVIDNGSGISDEDQGRVLQPFERVDGAYSQRGAGLGLALVKNITDLHDGSFEMISKEGQGTEVTLIFPRKRMV